MDPDSLDTTELLRWAPDEPARPGGEGRDRLFDSSETPAGAEAGCWMSSEGLLRLALPDKEEAAESGGLAVVGVPDECPDADELGNDVEIADKEGLDDGKLPPGPLSESDCGGTIP